MNKKPLKVMSTAALTAAFTSAAVVPAAVSADESQDTTLEQYIVEHEGQLYETSYSDYTEAKLAGVNLGEVKYVVGSDDNQYNYSDYTDAKLANGDQEAAFTALEEEGNVQDVDSGSITIDEDGNPVYNSEAEVSVDSVSAINTNQIEVTFDNEETVTIDLDEALVDGENEVTFVVDGNEYTETVNYDAPDTEAPVLNVDGETTVSVENGAELTLPEVTATDNEDESVEVTSVITDSEGNTVEEIDTTVAGTYTVTYSAEDAAGNVAEDVVVTVEVAEVPDTEAPQVTVDGLEDESTVYESSVTFSAEATDNEDEDIAPVVTVGENEVEANEDGTYTVELEEGENTITVDAVDEAGNTAETQTFSVTFDASIVNAEAAVEDFEASVDTVEEVEELVNDDQKLQDAMASFVPATNAVQKVSTDEKEALQNRLDAANDVVIAANFVNGLQDVTGEAIVDAPIKITAAQGNVSGLPEGDTKDTLVNLLNAKVEGIAESGVEALESAIVSLETQDEVDAAQALVEPTQEVIGELSDENENKAVFAYRVENAIPVIEDAQLVVTATEAVVTAEESLLEEDSETASELVDNLPDSDEKTLLEARVNDVEALQQGIIDRVNEASNDVQLYDALDVKPFVNVNKDNIAAYNDELGNENQKNTIDAIQTIVDEVNEEERAEELNALVDTAEGELADVNGDGAYVTENDDAQEEFEDELTEAQEAINAIPDDYVVEGEETPKAKQLQSTLDGIVTLNQNYVSKVKPVNEATTDFELNDALTSNFDNVNVENLEVYDEELTGDETTVEEVQNTIDYVNADEAVSELFGSKSKDSLANGVGQDDIDAAEELAELLPDETNEDGESVPGETEEALLEHIETAQELLNEQNAIASAEATVDALFAENEDGNTDYENLADDVTQEDIDAADEEVQALVEAGINLEDSDSDGTSDLEGNVETAQGLMNDIYVDEAEATVDALFAEDEDGNTDYENLADDVTQEDIDAADSEVQGLIDDEINLDGTQVVENLATAQELMNDNKIAAAEATVDALFAEDEDGNTDYENLADDVTQEDIDAADSEVQGLIDAEINLDGTQVDENLATAQKLAAEEAIEAFTDEEDNLVAEQADIDAAQDLLDASDYDTDEDTEELQADINAAQDTLYVNAALNAETTSEMRSAIVPFVDEENEAYRNLSSSLKNDVADIALYLVEERVANDEDYAPTFEELQTDLNNIVEDVRTALVDEGTLNTADTIVDMGAELDVNVLPEYQELSTAEQDSVAEYVLENRPEVVIEEGSYVSGGYTTVSAVKEAVVEGINQLN